MKHGISKSLRYTPFLCIESISDVCSRQEIYNATNEVRSAIPHPRIMGVIKECGGKMWMGESEPRIRNKVISDTMILLRAMESGKRRLF
jgi:hypothetical protein